MPMTIVVTRNVEPRVRGFLASTMLEIASGVYTSPTMSAAVRDRVWAVLEKWDVGSRGDGVVMTWPDAQAAGGQEVRVMGEPGFVLCETSTLVLGRRSLTEAELRSLKTEMKETDEVPF